MGVWLDVGKKAMRKLELKNNYSKVLYDRLQKTVKEIAQ